ncbi:MAG: hypothetical protein AAGA43_16415 [Bacteroidota bacterium]
MQEYFNVETLVVILSAIAALISFGWAVQWRFYKISKENLISNHNEELKKLENSHQEKFLDFKQEQIEAKKDLEDSLKKEYELKSMELEKQANIPLVQESKTVYVKYLHIRSEKDPPVYTRYSDRLEEDIEVHSEYHYYRFNKYNKKNNAIKLTDRSSGIVDQNILYPWKKLTFTDLPSKKLPGFISQNVESNDCYFSATTYYNGFCEGNEDIGSKMEMDTLEARIVADFSSIIGLDKLFVKEPDAYKFELDGTRTKLLGLEKIAHGVYHLAANNLKKDESLFLDFHVDWDYLNK